MAHLFLLVFVPVFTVFGEDNSAQSKIETIKRLYDSKRWEEVVLATQSTPPTPGDFGLYRGLALAHLKQWDEAQQALENALASNPGDARIMTELAGLAYRKKDFKRAKAYLGRSLKSEPKDEYRDDLLASIYSLEDNLEAALRHWNRVGKPQLSDLSFEPRTDVKPILLDRAFDFSRGRMWTRERLLTTTARLDCLDVFQTQRLDLEAQDDGTFHLAFRATEKPAWTRSPWVAAATTLSALPYQEIRTEFPNVRHSGWNWSSQLRWDDEKRRFVTELEGPLKDNPAWHGRLFVDLRNENWNLSKTLLPEAPSPAGVNLEKATAGMEIRSISNGSWTWSTEGIYSYRRMRNQQGLPPAAQAFFSGGSNVALSGEVARWLVRYPERRFTVDGKASGEAGTFFTGPLGRYGRLEADLDSHWYPGARGDDYETRIRLRAGHTFGYAPFDEFYVLGFDRDTGLWMRGHPGLVNGEKGAAPLGREYVLVNAETNKVVYSAPFIRFRVSPFIDTGKVYDSSAYFGTPRWMWDTGIQVKMRVFGSFEFVLGYGKDLRSGRNSFFSTVK